MKSMWSIFIILSTFRRLIFISVVCGCCFLYQYILLPSISVIWRNFGINNMNFFGYNYFNFWSWIFLTILTFVPVFEIFGNEKIWKTNWRGYFWNFESSIVYSMLATERSSPQSDYRNVRWILQFFQHHFFKKKNPCFYILHSMNHQDIYHTKKFIVHLSSWAEILFSAVFF